jgi:hypothetical protein
MEDTKKKAILLNSFFNIEKSNSSSKQKKPRKKPIKKPIKNKFESFSINTSSSSRDADSDENDDLNRIIEEEEMVTDIVITDQNPANVSFDSSYEEPKNGKHEEEEDKPGKLMRHEREVFKNNQPRKRKNLFTKEVTKIILNSEDDSSKSFDIDQHEISSSTSDDEQDDSLSIEPSQKTTNQSILVIIPEEKHIESLSSIDEEKNGTFYGLPSLIDSLYDIISYDKYVLQMIHFVKFNPISDETKGKFEQLLHSFAAQSAFDIRSEQKNDIAKMDHAYHLIYGKAPSLKYDITNGKRHVNEESRKIKEDYITENLRKEFNL